MEKQKIKEKDSNGYFEYIRKVRSAKLMAREKGLLYFYASMYNWDENEPSYAGIELIAAWTGMSTATVNRAKRKLKELEWIRDYRQDRYSKVYVWVTCGKEDPDYDKEGFSVYHTYKSKRPIPSFDQSQGAENLELGRDQSDSSKFERDLQKKQAELMFNEIEAWRTQERDEETAW
jgi:hypothetical protein